MRDTSRLIGFIILMVVGLAFVTWSNNRQIYQWADNQGYTVQSINLSFTNGPFWFVGEDDHVYRVEVTDRFEQRKIYYVIPGIVFRAEEWH